LIPILVADAFAGIPLAVALAAPLWVAVHVGAIADVMRGAPEASMAPPPAADGARGPLATLAALLAASTWIATGGTTRALLLLSLPHQAGVAGWAIALRALSDGLRLSIALSAGVLVAAVALEAAFVAVGRIAAPVSPQPIATLARPIVAVIALSISIEIAVTTLVAH
jgi:type III secretory pathway component EscT